MIKPICRIYPAKRKIECAQGLEVDSGYNSISDIGTFSTRGINENIYENWEEAWRGTAEVNSTGTVCRFNNGVYFVIPAALENKSYYINFYSHASSSATYWNLANGIIIDMPNNSVSIMNSDFTKMNTRCHILNTNISMYTHNSNNHTNYPKSVISVGSIKFYYGEKHIASVVKAVYSDGYFYYNSSSSSLLGVALNKYNYLPIQFTLTNKINCSEFAEIEKE